MGVGITGRKNGKIIRVVTITIRGLPLANTMKKRIKILFFFCAIFLLTKSPLCGIIKVGLSGSRTVVQTRIPDLYPHMQIFSYFQQPSACALVSRNFDPGSSSRRPRLWRAVFPPGDPICKFSETSSDSHMAALFPEIDQPRTGPHMPLFSLATPIGSL